MYSVCGMSYPSGLHALIALRMLAAAVSKNQYELDTSLYCNPQ